MGCCITSQPSRVSEAVDCCWAGVKTLVGNTYTTVYAGAQPVDNGEIDSGDGGDGNQENKDNEWPLTWQSEMDPCQHFELNRCACVDLPYQTCKWLV